MKRTDKKGFTIIEVVVVLAIAGLIFGIVFWALPNLQRSNRDSTRRTIAANIVANLDSYAANNNGAYPTTAAVFATFVSQYFPDNITDPLTGELYTPGTPWVAKATMHWGTAAVTLTSASVPGHLYAVNTGECASSTSIVVDATKTRAYAIAFSIEQGIGYCVDNN